MNAFHPKVLRTYLQLNKLSLITQHRTYSIRSPGGLAREFWKEPVTGLCLCLGDIGNSGKVGFAQERMLLEGKSKSLGTSVNHIYTKTGYSKIKSDQYTSSKEVAVTHFSPERECWAFLFVCA